MIMKSYRSKYDLTLKKIIPTEKEDPRVFLNDHHTPIVSKFRYYCRKLIKDKKIQKFEMMNWDNPRAKVVFFDGKEEEGDFDFIIKIHTTMRGSKEMGETATATEQACVQHDDDIEIVEQNA